MFKDFTVIVNLLLLSQVQPVITTVIITTAVTSVIMGVLASKSAKAKTDSVEETEE